MTTARQADAVADARAALVLNRRGLPCCDDAHAVLDAIATLERAGDRDMFDAVVTHGFLAGSDERFEEHVAPGMVALGPATFEMGTPPELRRHFVGEVPGHEVRLSRFSVARYAVTNEQYALLDPSVTDASRVPRGCPVVDVTWYEAALFALWMGCRLPTEAEWEFACGGGSAVEWCCAENELADYAWYSESSLGELHPVGELAANAAGLFDMHGNVWEWCMDDYDESFYSRSPIDDPLCSADCAGSPANKVNRGGSMHSLAEMCRTRYRLHDPPGFTAFDLGFRLARRGADA